MGALSQFTQSINWSDLGDMVLRVVAILICLIIHEVSHGLAAYKLGDPTAKMNHRLSLNPLRHLDLFGTLMICHNMDKDPTLPPIGKHWIEER